MGTEQNSASWSPYYVSWGSSSLILTLGTAPTALLCKAPVRAPVQPFPWPAPAPGSRIWPLVAARHGESCFHANSHRRLSAQSYSFVQKINCGVVPRGNQGLIETLRKLMGSFSRVSKARSGDSRQAGGLLLVLCHPACSYVCLPCCELCASLRGSCSSHCPAAYWWYRCRPGDGRARRLLLSLQRILRAFLGR